MIEQIAKYPMLKNIFIKDIPFHFLIVTVPLLNLKSMSGQRNFFPPAAHVHTNC